MGLGDTELDECLEGSVIANYWATTEEHCDVIKSYRETIRQAFYSGSTEHYDEKLTQAINDSHELVAEKKVKIEKAVNKGELKAIVEIRERGFDDGFKELTDKNRIRKIRDGYLRENHKDKEVRFTIHRDDFRAWLIKSKQWPLDDGCLLAKWFEAETVGDDGAGSQTTDNIKAYEKYKNSLDDWRRGTDINLSVLTVKNIFNQVIQTDISLWSITLESFKRDVWPKYSIENNLQKKPGRPKKQRKAGIAA